ncbi:DUF3197 domain-containing protein [Deinococcus hopiensis]|uniref:DUF3197 domain-containing protein n=1 Tax=Deinococcus hopiensis TaxID=309885 RepID=UPI000A028FCD|nr:DUF3197 domain-containing protein [Deinococcus hopiensis]
MHVADPFGVPGAPLQTLHAVLTYLEGQPDSRAAGAAEGHGRIILITDRQEERPDRRYAALLTLGGEALITAPAFGPAFGEAGGLALKELVDWAQGRGWGVRETVLNASDFTRVLAEPSEGEVRHLIAASNPSDPAIYTTLPKPGKRDDWAE